MKYSIIKVSWNGKYKSKYKKDGILITKLGIVSYECYFLWKNLESTSSENSSEGAKGSGTFISSVVYGKIYIAIQYLCMNCNVIWARDMEKIVKQWR